jgi:signal transduction histidine kinase
VIAIGTVLAEVIAVHPATGAAKGAASAAAPSLTAVVQVASAVILAVAGFAFVAGSWRAERGTELLVGASLLLAAAGVQFAAVQTVPADWVTPREGARLVAFSLLLGAAWLRHARVQRRHAYTAVCSERERIARDLHDGLAQDLACITTQAQRLDCRLAPDDPLMLATRDALAEVRGMIASLSPSTAPASELAARAVTHERADRFEVKVNVASEVGSVPSLESRTPQMGLPRRHPLARGLSRLSRERPLQAEPRRAA